MAEPKYEQLDYQYTPDGDRVLWNEKYCNGYPCPVDCYHCVVAQKILEAEDAKDKSEEDTPDAG